MLIVVVTLAAVAVGYGLFRAGRWYEHKRLSALVEWACSLAVKMHVSMAALETAEQQAGLEQFEQRVH